MTMTFITSGDDEWPTALAIVESYIFKIPILYRSSSCFNEVTFYQRKRFLDKCNWNPEHTLLLRPKGGFCVLLHFFFLSAVAHINVALVSCEKSLKTVTDERDFHHTSVSTVVRFIISSSIVRHKIFFIQTCLKSFSPVDSQDIFHPDRFYSLTPKWIHKIFFIQRGLKSSFPMDSQDLVQSASNARQLH